MERALIRLKGMMHHIAVAHRLAVIFACVPRSDADKSSSLSITPLRGPQAASLRMTFLDGASS
jgi:hypothetical protein